MFMSLPEYESHVPRALMPPNAQCWRALSLSLCVPWFVMSARFEESPDFVSTFILATDRDVAASIETLRGEVTSLICMYPRRVDESVAWQAHAIDEIWLATSSDSPGFEAIVLVGDDGLEIPGLFGERSDSFSRTKLLARISASDRGRRQVLS